MRSLLGSSLPGGGPGGGGGTVGVVGDDIGVSASVEEFILLPRPRTFIRSGCPFRSSELMPESCLTPGSLLPPREDRSVADAGPVGAVRPLLPDDTGLACEPFGPEGGPEVTTGGTDGRMRLLLGCIAGGAGGADLRSGVTLESFAIA